jgi:hypothetical protein
VNPVDGRGVEACPEFLWKSGGGKAALHQLRSLGGAHRRAEVDPCGARTEHFGQLSGVPGLRGDHDQAKCASHLLRERDKAARCAEHRLGRVVEEKQQLPPSVA